MAAAVVLAVTTAPITALLRLLQLRTVRARASVATTLTSMLLLSSILAVGGRGCRAESHTPATTV